MVGIYASTERRCVRRTVRCIEEHLWGIGGIPAGSTVPPLLVEYSLEFQRAIQQEQSVYIIMSCMVTVLNLYRHRKQYSHFEECVTPLLYRVQTV